MGIKSLLKIPKGYKIQQLEEKEEEVHITIIPYARNKAICSGCGQVHKDGFHGTVEVKVNDFPLVDRKVYPSVA